MIWMFEQEDFQEFDLWNDLIQMVHVNDMWVEHSM